MNHLLVSYHTCPLEEPGRGLSGGMNVFLRGLLPRLGACGIATDVLTRGLGPAAEVTEPFPGVRILHVPCGWREPPTRDSALASLPRFAENARRLLARIGRPYGVVSAHYWMSGVAALRLGDAVPPGGPVVVYHTVEERKEREPGARPDRLFVARTAAERLLAREAGRVVAFTREDLAATRSIFPEIAGKGAVIPPGVDDAFRRPPPRGAARRRFGLPPRGFVFLLAARSDPTKNVPLAVGALEALRRSGARDALLLLAGPFPGLRRAPGLRLAGPVPHGEMPQAYAAADAVLCPSVYESFGLVQLEALAAGVPIVVPAGGFWARRIGREGGGVVYDPRRPEGIREAMERITGERGAARRLSREARAAAAPFTWERCTASWARLLSRAATRGSRRRTPRSPGAPRRRGAARGGAS